MAEQDVMTAAGGLQSILSILLILSEFLWLRPKAASSLFAAISSTFCTPQSHYLLTTGKKRTSTFVPSGEHSYLKRRHRMENFFRMVLFVSGENRRA